VAQFDERILDIGLAAQEGEETSVAIHGEILFDEIPLYKRLSDPSDILKWALSPQPYIGGAVNLGGFTSYGGGGFLWRQKLGHKAYVDIASGGVLRTGTNGLDEEVLSGPNREIIFGSRFLFRQQFALGLNLSEQWSGEIFFEHLSNAGLGFVNEISTFLLIS